MSRPRPRQHSSHARVFSELHIGSHPLLPTAAYDASVGGLYHDPAADERMSDPPYRAFFWRMAFPVLSLGWAGLAVWVLS